ncbi:hypothetical protein BDV95DRAFT_611216 [Massariosphaeria phaeospora]|uniref:Glycosyltransferase family 25 protein n=1 Tax=Massariosphaeria phaeospora TaxID=100035 RepID=A0A7C8MDT1_9PLEO|nr:hypothetical protein BDV95DRAFT_611216 [Massariosphaeria phaeospora]
MPSSSSARPTRLLVAACLIATVLLVSMQHGYSFPRGTFKEKLPNSIANATLGFQSLLILSLPTRPDRLSSLTLAASTSNLHTTLIAGINGSSIHESAFPPGNHRALPVGNRGSWRAHLDAVRRVVERNLTTALILEDDADWDVRVRSQLEGFSGAARMLRGLVREEGRHRDDDASSSSSADSARLQQATLPLPPHISSNIPSHAPYGLDWDILWLGHCGAGIPVNSPVLAQTPDPTVPSPQHLRASPNAPLSPLSTLYPPQTRLYHRTSHPTLCTLAYAVTQRGARKLLYEFGVREFSKGYDFAVGEWCDGVGKKRGSEGKDGDEEDSTQPVCLTVNPPIFSHFFAEKGGSDITGVGAGGREIGTRYVRASVRENLERLVRGEAAVERWGDEED